MFTMAEIDELAKRAGFVKFENGYVITEPIELKRFAVEVAIYTKARFLEETCSKNGKNLTGGE